MECKQCLKVESLCVCSFVQPRKTDLQVLILQHPQEPDHTLGSARIAHLALAQSTLKVGLSWPNLSAALGQKVTPSSWMVLYLGSGIKEKVDSSSLQFVTRSGIPAARPKELQGMVVLDGTWTQAKALWWRNPWLLKLKRAVLNPQKKSLYGELRREPRKECLSTLESIAESLDCLGESPETGEALRSLFILLLDKQRARLKERQKRT